ncbi:hypothetical protein ACFE04_025138 [Oxalis oulophora]
MRSGGNCAVQQTLTAEAASVLKHSLSLARRRGHAQVTPLHVAATLLSSRTSLLKRACLKLSSTNPHPLQCRALELCFNVALNRLPATPGPLSQPCLSNALIAALKRAQAHQRRGCIEQQQQQPLLSSLKVELEQLVVSILDDPSVSRVMREAGFSSLAVKSNIEIDNNSVFHGYSNSTVGGVFSSPSSPTKNTTTNFWQNHLITSTTHQKDDIKLVFDAMLSKNYKRRNVVIVGDSISLTENMVTELTRRLERGGGGGDYVPDELNRTQFIRFQFSSMALRFMKREDVNLNLVELKGKVDRCLSGGGGAIIYVGDLKWTVDDYNDMAAGKYYSAVEHMVADIATMINEFSESNNKVWLMSSASYQTYMRCQMRHPSLETQWGLHPVRLGLLHANSSGHDSRINFSQDKLNCCVECISNYEKEAQVFKSGQQKVLPPWLQGHAIANHKDDDPVELRRKWNRLCFSMHQGRQPQSHYSATTSLFNNNNQYYASSPFSTWWGSPQSFDVGHKFKRQNSCTIEFNLREIGGNKMEIGEPSLDSLKNSTQGKEVKITLALGNSDLDNESVIERSNLSKILLENVPWQSESIPSIVETLIDAQLKKKDAWLLVEGNDIVGKRRLALAIAESVLGSANLLLHVNSRNRDSAHEYLNRALTKHEKLVVLVEDVELVDFQGKFGQSIFIMTNSSREMNNNNVIQMTLMVNVEKNPDHNKRKPEWEIMSKEFKNRPKIAGNVKNLSTLDLNMMATDEDEEMQDKTNIGGELIESIKKKFIFDTSPARDSEKGEALVSKMKDIFEGVFGEENVSKFSVEEKVIDGIIVGTGYFVNSLFEKWLKEIFQTSLHKLVVNIGGGNDHVSVKLLLGVGGGGGILQEEKVLEVGYMDTCLPNKIQVSFID